MKNLTILAYHRVFPEKRGSLAVTPEIFEEQLTAFLKKGYTARTLKEVYELYLKADKKLPRKTLVLTFDDGYRDNYDYAFPVLKKLKVPATIFLAMNYIGKNKHFHWDLEDPDLANIKLDDRDHPLTWDQVKEMSAAGLEFGSHTLGHPKLTDISMNDAWQEIHQSKKLLEEKLSKSVFSFCAPHGYVNSALLKLSQKAGYAMGVLNPPGIKGQDAGLPEDRYSLRRIGVYAHDSVASLNLKNSCFFNTFRKLRAQTSSFFKKNK